MKKELLECAKILAPHGVRGVMKLESYCDTPRILAAQKRVFLAAKDGTYKEAGVLTASVSGQHVLMQVEGITDRETVQGMQGSLLYLNRNDLKLRPGMHFLQDIIGLPVIDVNTGDVYGTVTDIQDAPRNKLYYIATEKGQVLLPEVDEFIKEIDTDRGVFVAPIPGFFD